MSSETYSVKDRDFLESVTADCKKAVEEILDSAKLSRGSVFIIGCSSSEVLGEKIGTHSSPDIAKAIFDGIYPVLKETGIYMAVQCCEHLNRAIITEKSLAEKLGLDEVNVVPQPKAGGSLAALAYKTLDNAVAVEKISADAGLDIGLTMIGMHLKSVAVPLRISVKKIGNANIVCARTRPKFIGGERAVYDLDKA